VYHRRWERTAEALGILDQTASEVLVGMRVLAEEPETPEIVRWAAREALERLEG